MGLLIIIVLLGVAYVLFMLPARRRRMQHAAMQDSITEGDEIITAGGLHAVLARLPAPPRQPAGAPGAAAAQPA